MIEDRVERTTKGGTMKKPLIGFATLGVATVLISGPTVASARSMDLPAGINAGFGPAAGQSLPGGINAGFGPIGSQGAKPTSTALHPLTAVRSATAIQFPTARQIAQHEGRLVAPSTDASVQFPTARQVALHEGRLSGPSLASTDQVASHSGFDWGDAGIGAGAAILVFTVVLYGAFMVNNRRRRGTRRATTA
jgi:hypothetical protein